MTDCEVSPARRSTWASPRSTSPTTAPPSTTSCSSSSVLPPRCKACCWRPRSAAPCWRFGKMNGERGSSASRSSGISGCRSRSPAPSPRWPGSLYALLNNFADPLGLHYSLSGEIVIMTVMGGMRAFWGPLVGAALFVVLQDYISSMTVNWMSFVGLIFVLVVLFFPRGMLGHAAGEERAMTMRAHRADARRKRRHQTVRQSGRRRQCVDAGRPRRTAGDHRPQRRWQDDILQHDLGVLRADLRRTSCSTATW